MRCGIQNAKRQLVPLLKVEATCPEDRRKVDSENEDAGSGCGGRLPGCGLRRPQSLFQLESAGHQERFHVQAAVALEAGGHFL